MDIAFDVDISGFLKDLEKVQANVPDRLGKAVMAGVYEAESWIKVDMGQQKSGKIYLVNDGKQKHQASAPGESPAPETGTLVNSLNTDLIEKSNDSATAALNVGAEHGIHMEFGTKYIAPRPFLRRAFIENRDRIKAAMVAILKADWL